MVFRGQTLGKYRIIETLGSGGFGTVYLAEDTWIDKRVALKVPHRQNLDFGELLREPRLLASLNHPNIVTTQGPLDLSVALDYTCQILNAVEHAHKQGVIHRDLRPANVFVTGEGMVKVGDFGTSRFLEIAAHGTTVIGSPPYMAPEQFEGRAVFASDLYSLGVTMYQLLTGVLPYDTPAPNDIDRLRRGELASPPKLRNPSIPAVLDQIVMRALSGEVSARYQRAEELLNDLLGARHEIVRRPAVAAAGAAVAPATRTRPTPTPSTLRRVNVARPQSRDAQPGRFCLHCRKPLPARAAQCPFCGESQ